MPGYAVLIGDSPEEFRQKKLEEMYDFLQTKEGGFFEPEEIVEFPNGISELTLESVLNNIIEENPKRILLYIVTKTPVKNSEKSVWAGGEEIRKDVIAFYEKLAEKTGASFQVVYDVCSDFISEDELGYEEAQEPDLEDLRQKGNGGNGYREEENGRESFV